MKKKITPKNIVLSKTKISKTGALSRKIITPVISTTHPAFKIGGTYFEPELYPDQKIIKELNLTKDEIGNYLLIISGYVKDKNRSDEEYYSKVTDYHNLDKDYFIEKRKGAANFIQDTYLAYVKKELGDNISKLTDVKQIIFN